MRMTLRTVAALFVISLLQAAPPVTGDTEFKAGSPVEDVVTLNQATLDNAIHDAANPIWLLEFYAPWCGHCKKLAPVLKDLAAKVKGKMAIGTIDCTVEKKLCDSQLIRGYPTLKFSLDGEIHDYPGGRKETDFLYFAEKLSRKEVLTVSSVEEAMKYAEESTDEGVAFLAYHKALSGETSDKQLQSSLLTQVFAQVARKQMAYASFLLLDPKASDVATILGDQTSTSQFICRIETNLAPRCYEKTQDINMDDLLTFVREGNVATVSHLGPYNFHKVGRSGRPLVIGVVDPEIQEQVDTVKRELSQFATATGPKDVREMYYYGWFDGRMFQKFLAQFDVVPTELPQVFVLDVPNKVYWQNATYGLNVGDFLEAVQNGTIEKKTAGKKGFEGVMEKFYYAMVEYRPWSVIFVVLLLTSFGVMILTVLYPPEHLRPPQPKPQAKRTVATNKSGNNTTQTEETAKTEQKEETATDESKKDK